MQQQAGDMGTLSEIWPWLVVLLCVVLVGGIVVAFVRRWMRPGKGSFTVGFTLSDLRELESHGRITKEELNRAEKALIQSMRHEAGPEDSRTSDKLSKRAAGFVGTEKEIDSPPEEPE